MFAVVALTASLLVGSRPAPHAERVRVPAGRYQPLYAAAGAERVRVAAFSIDREPVTRAQFETFVRQNPEWRRGTISGARSEASYLSDWSSATDAGDVGRERPVTDVSWFAANAYCEWTGGRLPTTDEWEYVAAASATKRDASNDASRQAALVDAYTARSGAKIHEIGRARANAFGVSDLHELVWEWTSDFNLMPAPHGHAMNVAQENHFSCASAAMGATRPSDYAAFLRYAFRSGLTTRSTVHGLGFRCAGAA